MASMDDLISTLNGGMHVGQQGNDLKDLHAKLAQTLHPTIPTYRPIPPTNTPHTSSGPMPPPAPVSSWNDTQTQMPIPTSWGNMGNSPRQGGFVSTNGNNNSGAVGGSGKREMGFSIPPPKSNGQGQGQVQGQEDRPYHASVLPVRASPKDTGGFGDDAFAPLWNGQGKANGHR